MTKVKLSHVQHVLSHVRKVAVESLAVEKDVPKTDKSTLREHELDLTVLMISATAIAWLLFR